MTRTRLNPKETIKAVRYTQPRSSYSGNQTFTHTAPSGYKLLGNSLHGAYCSGDPSAYPTDNRATQSGSTVTVAVYVYNPNSAAVTIVYELFYELA